MTYKLIVENKVWTSCPLAKDILPITETPERPNKNAEPEEMRFYIQARNDEGRPPVELCILKGLDKYYIGKAPSLNAIMLHKLRSGVVSRYIREGNFEDTATLPTGSMTFSHPQCGNLSVNFDGAREYILEYAREHGVIINIPDN